MVVRTCVGSMGALLTRTVRRVLGTSTVRYWYRTEYVLRTVGMRDTARTGTGIRYGTASKPRLFDYPAYIVRQFALTLYHSVGAV